MSKLAEEMATVEHSGRKAIDTQLYAKLIKYGDAVRRQIAERVALSQIDFRINTESGETEVKIPRHVFDRINREPLP